MHRMLYGLPTEHPGIDGGIYVRRYAIMLLTIQQTPDDTSNIGAMEARHR